MNRRDRLRFVTWVKQACRILAACITIWLCVGGSALAQSPTQSKLAPGTVTAPALSLKWSPLHLFYFYPSWQFSVEHRLIRKLNMQYEAGWVIRSGSNNIEYQNKRGYRGAVELRYYLPSPQMLPFYVSAEFYYHHIRFDRSETVGFNCGSGACDYFQLVTYPMSTEEMGPGLKFGLLLFPGWRKNRSFYFDFNSGFAYRNIRYSSPARPSGAGIEYFKDAQGWRIFSPDEALTESPRFIMGVRFCYRFI